MKKANRLLAILLVITMALPYVPQMLVYAAGNTSQFAGGTGTAADPYLIETKEHLNNVRNNLSAHYKMIADIVFTDADFTSGGKYYNSGRAWSPIGFTEYEPFTGTFDGNGHFVSGLILSRYNATCYAGLFGWCDGTIKNLGITNSTITIYAKSSYEYVYAGSIAGHLGSGSSVTNCWSDSDVFAYTLESNSYSRAYAGGIVGMAEGTAVISSCYNIGTVRANAPGYASSAFAGGITAGLSDGGTVDDSRITNCFNAGVVTGDGDTGGIVGRMWQGTVENCYNVGSVNGENVGGITGYAVSKAIINYNFYLSSVLIAVGNNTNNGTNKSCTPQQMASQATYANFDFITTWEFVDNNHYAYPTLISNPYFDSGFKSGSGTIDDPYLIETKEQLNNVRDNLSAHYRLVADIEFADDDFTANGSFYNDGSGFIPIGSEDEAFCGSFDGNGHSISNLFIYNAATTGDAYAGLFAINNGAINDLGIENGNISVYPDSNQYAYCGSIAGKNLGTITDCYSTGTVWSRRYAGGIAGYNSGSISDCYNNGVITASKDFDLSAGGIVGYNYDGTISNCYNNGQISSSAIVVSSFRTTYYAFAGGIVGYGYDGTIEKCYNTGDINATSNVTITENSDAYASANSGGIIGNNRSCSIAQCYNIGAISADTTADGYWYDTAKSYAGGIAGSNASGIGSCYNVGTLTTTSSTNHNYPGGIAGNNSGSINTSYNVASAIENIASSNSGTIKNCYFLSETLSAGCKLASLFSVLTYQGFDFESVWQMSDGDYPLPVLRSVKNHAVFDKLPEENSTDFASGKGTEVDPFVIKTITHLDNIRKYPSSYFVLANDIAFDPENEAFATGWKPFAFKGYLDGQGYKITGIRITVSNTLEYQWRDPGLFASNDGTIKNLTVEDMRISVSNMGDKYGGFICAVNNGVIINCHSKSCTVSLQNIHHFFGGIVGNNTGSIQNCTSNNTINWGANGGRIGGITANNTGSISGCTNNSTITNIGSYTPISGGISAQNSGDIISSNNLAPIITRSTYSQRNGYSGGIVGQMTGGKISQCYNLGDITTEATEYKAHTYSGGIVAYVSGGDIIDCYNTGDVYGEPNSSSASCYVGGIVGYNNSIGSIKNCYSVGGNSGRASSSNLYVGYVCGYNASNTIDNCYYLGIADNGSGSGDLSTMYGENVTALKNQSTYVGFDFTNTWTASGNSDYPFPELTAVHMIYEKEVKAVQVDSLPSKLKYIQNYESLDVEGGTLKVTYEYDEHEVIPLSKASLSGFDNSVIGKQTMYVSYAGKTCTFEIEIEAMTYGDVNSDGVVDTLDRMVLSRNLANWDGYGASSINMSGADVNGDGVVDTLDRMILNRYLANWEGYESLPNAG